MLDEECRHWQLLHVDSLQEIPLRQTKLRQLAGLIPLSAICGLLAINSVWGFFDGDGPHHGKIRLILSCGLFLNLTVLWLVMWRQVKNRETSGFHSS